MGLTLLDQDVAANRKSDFETVDCCIFQACWKRRTSERKDYGPTHWLADDANAMCFKIEVPPWQTALAELGARCWGRDMQHLVAVPCCSATLESLVASAIGLIKSFSLCLGGLKMRRS